MASDDQPGKKRFKKAQKQPSVSKKVKVTQEAKKAKEADKLNAEKKRKAELAAKLAQATKRISSQKQQSSGSLTHPSTEIHLEGNNIHTLSLPAFREQQNPLSQIQAHQLASGLHNQENNNTLIKIEAWLVYFLYTKSIHFLHLTTLVYIFSIHQIYIKQNFVL